MKKIDEKIEEKNTYNGSQKNQIKIEIEIKMKIKKRQEEVESRE